MEVGDLFVCVKIKHMDELSYTSYNLVKHSFWSNAFSDLTQYLFKHSIMPVFRRRLKQWTHRE